MTVSIRISKIEPHREVEAGGLMAAFTGAKQYVPAGSTDVEITADNEFNSASEAAGWVEEIAIVASSTFRHAVYGETALVGEFEDEGEGVEPVTGWSGDPLSEEGNNEPQP